MTKHIFWKKGITFAVMASLVCAAGILPQTASAGTGTVTGPQKEEAQTAEEVLSTLEEMVQEDEAERIIVDGEVTDADAELAVCENGITILQYASEAEAAAAEAAFEADGYDAVQDELLQVTTYDTDVSAEEFATYSTYEAQSMNLECNAEGEEEVLVALIDTGANSEYLDTEQFVTGYNAEDGSTDVTDNAGHGTMTASIVSSYTGDNVSILPIKLMDDDESGVSYATLFAAFEYALQQGVDIVSMSLGLEVDSRDPRWRMEMQEYEQYIGPYIDNLTDAGITVIVAAGNSAISTDYVFPAGYGDCWSISAIDENNEFCYFSNYGDIDFCALGEGVTVMDKDGTVETNDGTSFSAPLVAAAAAQLAGNGLDSNEERYEYMQTICLDLGTSGYDRYYGYGLPQMEHNYKVETTTATCVEAGDTVYTCACGETYTVTGETIDHIAGDAVITETEDGGQVWDYYCTMCGELLAETVYTYEELYPEDTQDDTSDGSGDDTSDGSGGNTLEDTSGGSGSDTQNGGDTEDADGKTSGDTQSTDTEDSYTVPKTVTSAAKTSLTGATVSQVTQTLALVKGDGDLKDSSYGKLRARAVSVTKSSVKLKWKSVSGAASYVIYGTKCGSSNKYKKIKRVTTSSVTVKKIAGTALKKGTYYKFLVVALDANGKVIETAKVVHAATKGGTKTNVKSVSVCWGSSSVTSLTLGVGSTEKITVKTVKQDASKTIAEHRSVRYESSNTSVASVNANGKITAKKAGTCYIYAYAQNGKFKRIRVTVQ